ARFQDLLTEVPDFWTSFTAFFTRSATMRIEHFLDIAAEDSDNDEDISFDTDIEQDDCDDLSRSKPKEDESASCLPLQDARAEHLFGHVIDKHEKSVPSSSRYTLPSTSNPDSSETEMSCQAVRVWIADAILRAQHIWDEEDAQGMAEDTMPGPTLVPQAINRPKGTDRVLTNHARQLLQQWAAWAAWEQDAAPDDSLVTRRDLAPGEWVRIRERGVYRDDVGVVYSATTSQSGTQGYLILLIPRLPSENEMALIQVVTQTRQKPREHQGVFEPSEKVAMKRKRTRVRPEPRLFDPTKLLQSKVTKIEANMFRYQRAIYSYGLRVKFFPETSLDPRLPCLSSNLWMKFIDSRHPFVVLADLPCLDYWSFEEGEVVTVCDVPGLIGAVISVDRELKSCVVTLGSKNAGGEDHESNAYAGLLSVPMKKLEKVVKVGDYVSVVAGTNKGKEGLVTDKHGTDLHIFSIAPSPTELDEPGSAGRQKGTLFRVQKYSDVIVHSNSVKLSTPPFVLDHGPWFNVWVVVNTVKGVVTLKKKEERVKIKYVRRTGPNKLGVFVYMITLDATAEFEPQDLLDGKTKHPLLTAWPLPERYRQFCIDPELHRMYTGRGPWFGVHRVEVSRLHRIKVQVELDLFTIQSDKLEWVFIKDVLVVKTEQPLYVFWPVPKSSLFYPSQEDLVPLTRRLQHTVFPQTKIKQAAAELQQEQPVDPWDPWDPRQPSPPIPVSELPDTDLSQIYGSPAVSCDEQHDAPPTPQAMEDDENTFRLDEIDLWDRISLSTNARVFTGDEYAPPPPTPPCRSPSPEPLPPPVLASSSSSSTLCHWCLHPNLVDKLVQVKFADLPKATFLQTTKRPTGVIVPMRKMNRLWQDVSDSEVQKCPVRTFTNQSLMVIVDGEEEHIGKLVRGIYYFFNGIQAEERKWWMVITVNPKMTWMPAEMPELLDIDPDNLALTDDTSEAKANVKSILDTIRAAARTRPPEVRQAYDEDSSTLYFCKQQLDALLGK
ncbi:hypothetical protein MPER_13106, partial [Moniliophthora perniciosa FA553]